MLNRAQLEQRCRDRTFEDKVSAEQSEREKRGQEVRNKGEWVTWYGFPVRKDDQRSVQDVKLTGLVLSFSDA
jgi:hypothetical protein